MLILIERLPKLLKTTKMSSIIPGLWKQNLYGLGTMGEWLCYTLCPESSQLSDNIFHNV